MSKGSYTGNFTYSSAEVGKYYLLLSYWNGERPDNGSPLNTLTGATFISRAYAYSGSAYGNNSVVVELIKATSTTISYSGAVTIVGIASI